MRNMSFMLTEPQVRLGTKTVTRRLGWLNLRVGEQIVACEKCQGLKKGEKLNRICIIAVKSVRRERLDTLLEVPRDSGMFTRYARAEVRREGFPGMTPIEFVRFFCKTHKGCTQGTTVTRIQFAYLT